MATDRNTALVTGASSGIGAELARVHAERGGDLVVVARRREKLEALKAELERAYHVNVRVLAKDLAERGAPQEIYDELQSSRVAVDILVNNAGFGHRGPFHELPWATSEAIIQVNVLALTALTRLFVPSMVERGRGRVMNVASMAGFVPGPLMAVYYASKAFVVSFSETIADELAGTGVTVTALCPGPTQTEFAERAEMTGTRLMGQMVSAREVAEIGYDAMLRGKIVVVPGLLNKLTIHGLLRISPRRLNTRISRTLTEER